MFEDRSKNGNYDFSKYDKHARTQVVVDEKKVETNNQAYKTLFLNQKPKIEEKTKTDILGRVKTEEIMKDESKQDRLSTLPSSAYLRQFENQIATEVEEESLSKEVETIEVEEKSIDFSKLIDMSDNVEMVNKTINKEIKKINLEPQKSFSFRIKLVTGVYCILVALFGGWVIGNTIDLIQTNNNINNAVTSTEKVNTDIADVLIKMEQLDSVSPDDRKDDSLLVKITTETIEITPEAIESPNEYEKSSNWFDVVCDAISGIFGGK